MATNQEFQVLLREYAPHSLLENEIMKLNWFLKKVKKDPKWGFGPYQIPVETQEYSRFEFGQLPASNDIPNARYAKPEVSSPAELFGAMKFNNKDLERHSGDLKKSFLQVLPGKVRQFVKRMEEKASLSMVGDGSICTLTANGDDEGLLTVNRPWLLTGGEKVLVKDSNSQVEGYIRDININTKTCKLFSAAVGGTEVDCSGLTTAAGAKIYIPGSDDEQFTSLIDIVFPASMGGADTLYGGAITKLDSPVYQPFAKDISSAATYETFKQAMFDFYYEAEQMGRGETREVLVPYSAFKALALSTEDIRRRTGDDVKTSVGARSMKLVGPDGDMVITGVRDMVDGFAVVMDWDAVVFASRGELVKKANEMGSDYFEERNQSGYTYICDKKMEGELIVNAPYKLSGAKIATAFSAT